MTGEPLVSVVIPVRNRPHCVNDAVGSVLAQTHRNVECLVVDDGSTDHTVAVLTAAFADDPRVRIFPRAHTGVSAARNFAIERAQGELITFLDSDDLMVEHRVERQIAHLRESDDDAVMARQRQVLEHGARRPPWLERRPEWWDGYFHTSTMTDTWRARVVGGFDEQMALGEDIDFVVRLATIGTRVGVLEEALTVRRFFGDNLTSQGDDDDGFRIMLGAVRRHRARLRAGGGRVDERVDDRVDGAPSPG